MNRIFWDTNLFIYLWEGLPEFLEPTRALLDRMTQRGDDLLTSAMTLGEVQVKPRRAKRFDLAEQYADAIQRSCEVVSFDAKAAAIYALLRENPAIKPQDAIQLSCAGAAGVELFVTNDAQLSRITVPGVHFVTSLAKVPI